MPLSQLECAIVSSQLSDISFGKVVSYSSLKFEVLPWPQIWWSGLWAQKLLFPPFWPPSLKGKITMNNRYIGLAAVLTILTAVVISVLGVEKTLEKSATSSLLTIVSLIVTIPLAWVIFRLFKKTRTRLLVILCGGTFMFFGSLVVARGFLPLEEVIAILLQQLVTSILVVLAVWATGKWMQIW